MGVSKNHGTPKSSILIGFSIINHPFWGTTIFGNTHMFVKLETDIFSRSREPRCFSCPSERTKTLHFDVPKSKPDESSEEAFEPNLWGSVSWPILGSMDLSNKFKASKRQPLIKPNGTESIWYLPMGIVYLENIQKVIFIIILHKAGQYVHWLYT